MAMKGKKKINVLIVCTGNTCRSPMAEGILKKMLGGDDSVEVLSGGLMAHEGERVSEDAVEVLAAMNIDISSHTAKNINGDVVRDADLILTMTQAHKDMICAVYGPDAAKKTYTICEYAHFDGEIADPFGLGIKVYRHCAEELEGALEKALERIRAEL